MKKILLLSFIAGATLFAQSATQLLKDNGCMACHGINTVKKAPPFAGIAKRNSRRSSDPKGDIMYSIKHGSEGKYPMFSDTKMPAFSYLGDEQLSTLADWILEQAPANFGRGKSRGRGMGGGMGKGMGRGMM